MGFHDGPKIVTNGLVLSLDASDDNSYAGSGTVWTDMSGNRYDATMSGSIAYSGSLPDSFHYITGSTNLFVGNSNLTGSIIDGVTISTWVNLRDTTQRGIVFNKYTASGAIPGYLLEIGTVAGLWTNTLRFYGQGTSVNSTDLRGFPNTITQNTIFLATATFDYATKTTALYVNNSRINASQSGSVASLSSDWYRSLTRYSLGSLRLAGSATDSPMNQYNLMVYNRALSADEINQNYNSQKSRFGL